MQDLLPMNLSLFSSSNPCLFLGGSKVLPPHPQNLLLSPNLQFPLWSFILSQIPSLRFVGVLNSQHSLFYPLPHPRPLPPGPFVNPYLFIGILPCLMELSHGDPVWTPIKFCQFGLEELLRACSFSPSQKFLQKSKKTQEHSGQHRDENVPSCLLPQWD